MGRTQRRGRGQSHGRTPLVSVIGDVVATDGTGERDGLHSLGPLSLQVGVGVVEQDVPVGEILRKSPENSRFKTY